MLEGGVDLLLRPRESEPGLDAGKLGPTRPNARRRALGMDDTAPGGHQIHSARLDRPEGAERIAMVDRSGEQVGDGRKVDVRVRPHVDALPRRQVRRAHLVEEDEGARPSSVPCAAKCGAP
jgi:hypothetical protein